MRALLIHPGPDYSVHDVYAGWAEGLRDNGIHVDLFPMNDLLAFFGQSYVPYDDGTKLRLAIDSNEMVIAMANRHIESAVFQSWPHVVIVVSGFFMSTFTMELIRSRGIPVVVVCTEQPYETERELKLASFADIAVLNDPLHLDRFQAVTEAYYQPHCYRPKFHRFVEHMGESLDFGWVGTAFKSRIEFFERMDFEGLRVGLGGNWQELPDGHPLERYLIDPVKGNCTPAYETLSIYADSRASLNTYRQEAEGDQRVAGWAMGPREVELAATGTFFLRQHRPESDEVLPMLPAFDSPEEASDLLRWWTADARSEQRRQVTIQARAAIEDRSFTNAAAALLNRLADKTVERAPALQGTPPLPLSS